MRILFVSNTLPYPPHDGGRIRRFHALRTLASAHRVTLLAAVPEAAAASELHARHPEIRLREIPFRRAEGRVPVARAVRDAVAGETFDAVHVASLWQWPGAGSVGGARVVLDAENVESLLLRRLRDLGTLGVSELDVRTVEALERQALAGADRVLACSELDASLLRELAPGAEIAVVPNGVDCEALPFSPRTIRAQAPVLLFTGILTYRPNVDAIRFFALEVLPEIRRHLPGAVFRIVGRYPSGEVMELAGRPGVEIVADVPEIRPFLEAADLYVAPLRAGSGTRIKLLEAMASGRPIVTTPVGCEGLEVEAGRHLLVAEGPEAIARSVCELVASPALAEGLALYGRHLVERRYRWEASGEALLASYERLAGVAP